MPPTSTVREILVGGGEALAQQQFVNLLEGVSITVAQHGIRRTIRDWPFENFWTDPDEPLHSKFLGYFINPRQGHNCSDFLLKHFLKVLKGAIKPASLSCRTPPSFRADGCEVNDPEAERIDLCIERTCDDEKFAIIIENKIHFAIDQPNQLQGYVQKVHQRGFDYSQIWVFYAPLTAEKDPDPDDRSAVERLGVCYNKITFQTEIVAWLNNALAPGQLDLPSDMDGGMADNLGHYRDLIRHLIEKHKDFQMKSQILQQLHQAQDAGTMPKFSDLDSMRESMASLQKCLEQVYRAKLMREIHRLLTVQRKKVLFCLEAEPAEEISINSDFDERFDANVDVCVSVDQGCASVSAEAAEPGSAI